VLQTALYRLKYFIMLETLHDHYRCWIIKVLEVNVQAVVLVCLHTERNFALDVSYCLVRIHDVIPSRAPYSSLETGS
jgi:hypothetical protein